MKFKCDNCGDIDEAIIDGYEIGDKILEGVKFKVRKNDDGSCNVESVDDWDSDPYLIGLNKEYWIDLISKYCENQDIFFCPHCHNDVIPEDMLCEENPGNQGIPVKCSSIQDILGNAALRCDASDLEDMFGKLEKILE